MNRPSHWLLAFWVLTAAVLGLAFWISGGQQRGAFLRVQSSAKLEKVKTPLIGEGFAKLEGGEAAKDAEILVLGTDARVRADDTGRFRIPLPFRECVLVAHDGRQLVALSQPFQPSRDHGLLPVPDLVLSVGARLQGLVRDEHGAPISGARVLLSSDLGRRETATAADGSFAMLGLLAEAAGVEVQPPAGFLASVRKVVIAPQGTAVELVLAKDEPWKLSVVDSAGAARPGVLVAATDSDGRRAEATTDAGGFVTLLGIVRAQVVFTARNSRGDLLAIQEYDDTARRLVVR